MTPMPASPSKSTGQSLYGGLLILLATLGLILLLKDLSRRTPGKSRVDWPPAIPAKP